MCARVGGGGRRLAPHREGAGADALPTRRRGAPAAARARGRGPSPGRPLPAPPSRPRASPARPALPRAALGHRARRDQSREPASRDHGLRRPRVGAAPPQPTAHAHLLERLLQLRPVHRLPGAHAAGPALPDAQLAAPDLLGLLLAAALPPAGQRPRGRLQEDLPVPMAVLTLLSRERLLTCCPQSRPLLLSADELALETQPPEKEDASSLPPKFQSHPGHEDLFSCCQRKNLRGAPYSFFAIHITAALVLFMTDGLTGAYSAFVYSYAVEKPLSVGHKVAGYLPSLFWGFITLGRLLSIPISSRMKPATMVFINVVGVVVTFLVLLIFSYNVVFLFVGTASLGLFLSSTFPSMLAYTEDSLQYKGCATTVLVTGAGVGEMVLQMLVGSIFQAQGSYSFLVCGVIFGCLAFTFYILLLFFHRMHPGLPSVPTQDRSIGMENADCYQR
ncbi:major facilitator superfamily domain-containing protein 4A isoform X3 [Callithrix jacchus]|uniref:major facilitator superfamily domain-containing protein 4A isoform X3 n=1 Tax=Callithrix jacchus TaxID=9483 RepID=UPI0023DD5401|nr:major facilitator superfamily domain-containing protein 4A isoform X3 [Callithrix jacchus]